MGVKKAAAIPIIGRSQEISFETETDFFSDRSFLFPMRFRSGIEFFFFAHLAKKIIVRSDFGAIFNCFWGLG